MEGGDKGGKFWIEFLVATMQVLLDLLLSFIH